MKLHYDNLSLESIVYLDDNSIEHTEIWKDIPDYEGYYQVSDLGRIRSLNRKICKSEDVRLRIKTVLKQSIDSFGYLKNGFYKDKKHKMFRIHQLVAIVFLNHVPNKFKIVVDHINNKRFDNRLSNLQVISQRENVSKDRFGSSNFTGVHLAKNGKFKVSIRHQGNSIYLGSFDIEIEASEYYQNALKSINNGTEIVKNFTNKKRD